MRTKFDQLSKALATGLLAGAGRVEAEREILGHAQAADLWFEPAAGGEGALRDCGFLGRMVAGEPCLIEFFSQPPRLREIRACMQKQYSLHHLDQLARGEGEAEPVFPRLWVISAGSPEQVMEKLGLRAMEGWPAGFFAGREYDRLSLVNVHVLPKEPPTLFLRLLGRGPCLHGAMREATRGDDDAWTTRVVRQVLLAFRGEFGHNPTEEEMQTQQEMEAAYKAWERRAERRGEKKGEKKGKKDAMRKAVETVCELLGIELTAARQRQLSGCDVAALERLLEELRQSRQWPDTVG